MAATTRFETPYTSLTLPAPMLAAGQAYVVRIVALQSGSLTASRLVAASLPLYESAVVSGVLRP